MSQILKEASSSIEIATQDPERGTSSQKLTIWQHLKTDVEPTSSTTGLAAFSFMTGVIDAISFTATFVWCGFQTGNFIQLSLALARLFSPPNPHDLAFHIADRQALTSLITFMLGASVGRLGDRIGNNSRLWLIGGTLLQALFTMAAALSIWKSGQGSIAAARGEPSWSNVKTFVGLGFMSASVGLQGIMGKRVNSAFGTTVVLTTIWCEVVSDPKLFSFGRVTSRDHRVLAAGCIFVGGFFGRALVDKIGAAGTLGVGAGIRVLIAAVWWFTPAKVVKGKD